MRYCFLPLKWSARSVRPVKKCSVSSMVTDTPKVSGHMFIASRNISSSRHSSGACTRTSVAPVLETKARNTSIIGRAASGPSMAR